MHVRTYTYASPPCCGIPYNVQEECTLYSQIRMCRGVYQKGHLPASDARQGHHVLVVLPACLPLLDIVQPQLMTADDAVPDVLLSLDFDVKIGNLTGEVVALLRYQLQKLRKYN